SWAVGRDMVELVFSGLRMRCGRRMRAEPAPSGVLRRIVKTQDNVKQWVALLLPVCSGFARKPEHTGRSAGHRRNPHHLGQANIPDYSNSSVQGESPPRSHTLAEPRWAFIVNFCSISRHCPGAAFSARMG